VTGVPAYWSQPSFKQVAYAEPSAIDFTSAAGRKRQLDQSLSAAEPRPPKAVKRMPAVLKPTQNKITTFYETIKFANSGIKPVVLSVVEDYSSDYVTRELAPFLAELREFGQCDVQARTKDLLSSCTLDLNAKNCREVEKRTRMQAKATLWHRLRVGRITASNMRRVCHTNMAKPSVSLVRELCGSGKRRATEAMMYGIKNEEVARAAYARQASVLHVGFTLRPSGSEPQVSPHGSLPRRHRPVHMLWHWLHRNKVPRKCQRHDSRATASFFTACGERYSDSEEQACVLRSNADSNAPHRHSVL
jgi:hypothetical protein